LFFTCCRNSLAIIVLLIGFTVCASTAQQPSAPDSAASIDTIAKKPAPQIELTVEVVPADTIPDDFLQIVDNLGLHRYTDSLLSRMDIITDELIKNAIRNASKQADLMHANAFIVWEAIRLISQEDSLWSAFFFDLDVQLKEPNIISIIFRDDQRWKSYALNELFFSPAFQELLLIMGNLGIAGSKDGKQFLSGWPTELRWKYREYSIEYIPEDQITEVRDFGRRPGSQAPPPTSSIRLTPATPVLIPEASDSVEPPLKVPRL